MSWVVSLTFAGREDAMSVFRALNDARNGNGLLFTSWPEGALTYSERWGIDVSSVTSVKCSQAEEGTE